MCTLKTLGQFSTVRPGQRLVKPESISLSFCMVIWDFCRQISPSFSTESSAGAAVTTAVIFYWYVMHLMIVISCLPRTCVTTCIADSRSRKWNTEIILSAHLWSQSESVFDSVLGHSITTGDSICILTLGSGERPFILFRVVLRIYTSIFPQSQFLYFPF